jgi:hypothetical protein
MFFDSRVVFLFEVSIVEILYGISVTDPMHLYATVSLWLRSHDTSSL